MTVPILTPCWVNSVIPANSLEDLVAGYTPDGSQTEVARFWRLHNMMGGFFSARFDNKAVTDDLTFTLPEGYEFDLEWLGIDTLQVVDHYPVLGMVNAITFQGGDNYGTGSGYLLDAKRMALTINDDLVGPGNPGNWASGGRFSLFFSAMPILGWRHDKDNPPGRFPPPT